MLFGKKIPPNSVEVQFLVPTFHCATLGCQSKNYVVGFE